MDWYYQLLLFVSLTLNIVNTLSIRQNTKTLGIHLTMIQRLNNV